LSAEGVCDQVTLSHPKLIIEGIDCSSLYISFGLVVLFINISFIKPKASHCPFSHPLKH
jgi:hypothetical protein